MADKSLKEKETTTSDEESSLSEVESSLSEEEDEDGKEWTEEIEKTFFKTLSSLKSKDPKIYDENVKFFTGEIHIRDVDSNIPTKKTKKEGPMYLRDYERKIILEKDGILTDEENDDNHKIAELRTQSRTYVEEQKMLKENFKKLIKNSDSEDETECGGFLKIKIKNIQEKAKEEADFVEWLKGQKIELNDEETESQLKYLRDYWTNPELNDGECFIRDYILNKKYLEKYDESRSESEVSFSEEEKILKECDEYELKYNFRFEEPDKDFIKTYPRVIESSLRRKDEKRKRKREERKKRKEAMLEKKRLEVKGLQKQKKQELLDRIQKLKELTGNKELGFDDKDLQGDFDPDEYDIKMSQLFNEQFYANANDREEKPRFSDDLDSDLFNSENEGHETETNAAKYETEGSAMDCDYQFQEERQSKFKKQTRSSRRKGHKKSTFADVVKKKKPLFDPADKTFQEYLDEYYGLEFEDVISDMPCRFKYRKVMPNNFGLTVEEILAADDKELNNWCSMKKVDVIRPEQQDKFDKKIYERRAQNLDLKKKFLPSLFINKELPENNESSAVQESLTKKKRRKSYKLVSTLEGDNIIEKNVVSGNRKKRKYDDKTESNDNPAKKQKLNLNIPNYSMKKRRKDIKQKDNSNKYISKFRSKANNNKTDFAMSDERLKAYGLNPKKFKNKMKYSSS